MKTLKDLRNLLKSHPFVKITFQVEENGDCWVGVKNDFKYAKHKKCGYWLDGSEIDDAKNADVLWHYVEKLVQAIAVTEDNYIGPYSNPGSNIDSE